MHGDFGKTVDLLPGSLTLGDYALSKRADGTSVAVRRCEVPKAVSIANDCLRRLQELCKGPSLAGAKLGDAPVGDAAVKDLRERLDEREAKPGAAASADEQQFEGEDCRTLWIVYDDHKARFKQWREVCCEIKTYSFGDGWSSYHDGPSCCQELFKNWGRNNSDPMLWLSQFLKEYDIGPKERTAIEMKTLVRSLWLSGVYDQLNAPSCAALEELARRVCQLIEAYESGSQGRPNWAGVKHFTSVHSCSTVVPNSIRSFAHRKVKEEIEAENLRLRAQSTTPVFEERHGELPAAPRVAPASPRPAPQPSPGPKGKGKTGPRRLRFAEGAGEK